MSRSPILLSLEADRDLEALFDWIARDSGVDRAEAILRRIDETLELVATMPRIGRVRPDLDGAPRTFAVWPRVILYEPLSPGARDCRLARVRWPTRPAPARPAIGQHSQRD